MAVDIEDQAGFRIARQLQGRMHLFLFPELPEHELKREEDGVRQGVGDRLGAGGPEDPHIPVCPPAWQGICPSALAPSAHPWMVRTPGQAWAGSLAAAQVASQGSATSTCTPDIGKESASYRPPHRPG